MRVPCLLFAAALASVTTAASAGMMTGAGSGNRYSAVVTVGLVCDQNCRCWKTGYARARNDYRERVALNICSDGTSSGAGSSASYNGYYRLGPSAGLNFESRLPTNSFPF